MTMNRRDFLAAQSILAFRSIGFLPAAWAPIQSPSQGLLGSVRRAIGHKSLKSLLLLGQSRSGFESGAPSESWNAIEIRVLFPHSFLQIEEVAGRGFVRWRGFDRTTALVGSKATVPTTTVGSSAPGPDYVRAERLLVCQFLLGAFADTYGILQIEATVESPPGVLQVDIGGSSARLHVDRATGEPVKLTFAQDVYVPDSRAPRSSGRGSGGGSVERAEVTLSFEDRRLVEGTRVPHRIVRSARGVRLQEWRFESIRFNPPLTASDFRR